MSQPISRRRFLGQVNCAAISSLPILSTLLNLKLAGTLAADTSPTDHRALVCLFFSGGMDSFNVLVPHGPSEYAEYKRVRGGVALPQASLLGINPLGSPGLQLGLHPGLPELKKLFDDGHAAFVSNVGTLIEPITKNDYDNDLKRLPLGLYSHSDQIEQWHTSLPHTRSSKGWAGRVADMLRSLNTNDNVSMNISLSGSNTWQSGDSVYEYTVGTEGAEPLNQYDPSNTDPYSTVPIRTKAIDSQLGFQYQHLLQQAFTARKQGALDAYTLFNRATADEIPGVIFPDTHLGRQLKMVAKAIGGHEMLGQLRQTFFVEYGGWDHHNSLIKSQGEMLPEVDAAIKAFYAALTALGRQNNVTLFTASDFGRTLTTDAAGTDHAWGGNQFVVGGAVRGNRIYGRYPDLDLDNPLDVGRGRLIPQVSVDSYFAELALWFGVPKSRLTEVFPNLGNFYSAGSSTPPLGFVA